MEPQQALDRARLRRWWISIEGQVFREWITARLANAGEFLCNESIDLAVLANQTKASRMQGEARLLRFLVEKEDDLLNELDAIANPTYPTPEKKL